MFNLKHKATAARSKSVWVTPLKYSLLWIKEDWRLAHSPKHEVGEEPADSWLVLVLRSGYWLANAISPWEWINYFIVQALPEPLGWLHSHDRLRVRYWLADMYTVLSTLLVWLVAHWASRLGTPAGLAGATIAVFLAWRLFEIWRVMLRVAIIDYIGEAHPHTTISTMRYLLYMPLYLFQVVLIFAAIYLLWTPDGFTGNGLPVLGALHQFTYISLTTITTLGSGYTATSEAAQTWQAFESVTGLVLFGIGLSTFLSGLKLRVRRRDIV